MNRPQPPAAALLAAGQPEEEVEGQWKHLPQELLMNVVKCMQLQDRDVRGGVLLPSSGVVRQACRSWRRIFDAACTWLRLQRGGLAQLEFPAVLCGLCGRLPALTALDLRAWELVW